MIWNVITLKHGILDPKCHALSLSLLFSLSTYTVNSLYYFHDLGDSFGSHGIFIYLESAVSFSYNVVASLFNATTLKRCYECP